MLIVLIIVDEFMHKYTFFVFHILINGVINTYSSYLSSI